MTVEEFKKLKPELAHLKGDSLWDAMTMYKLQQQQAEEVLKVALPFFKHYTLRWLFYRKLPNMTFAKYSDKRCKHCKRGTGTRLVFIMFDAEKKSKFICACGHPYESEPNTNLDYRIYKITRVIHHFTIGIMWGVLDWLHIVRSSTHSRYETGMGDESMFVQSWTVNMKTGKSSYKLYRRRWWQYIFIEKPNLNF